MAGIYSTCEIEHKRFTKKQGVDYLSFLIDCQCWASLNSLYRRQIGPFTAYHEVNNILRRMVVITLREGDLLNPLPFSIIGCCFYAVLLYAVNVIRRVIKAHQQDKYWIANCPNADLNLKKVRADSVIKLLPQLEDHLPLPQQGCGAYRSVLLCRELLCVNMVRKILIKVWYEEAPVPGQSLCSYD